VGAGARVRGPRTASTSEDSSLVHVAPPLAEHGTRDARRSDGLPSSCFLPHLPTTSHYLPKSSIANLPGPGGPGVVPVFFDYRDQTFLIHLKEIRLLVPVVPEI
jgi:hypothetical protein